MRHILESIDPLLSRRVEVRQKAGQGNIVNLLKSLKDQFDAVKMIGAFDGDQKGSIPKEIAKLSVFLPGTRPIEAQFRDILRHDHSALARITDDQSVGTILAGLEGLDIHDWYDNLALSLGRTQEQIFTIMYPIWERYLNNKDVALQFIADMRPA